MNSFKINLSGKSKNRKKEAKYIPAAIIPSAAFVANPTLPQATENIDENSNKLLSSTLNSSLVGLSAEYRKHQILENSDHENNEDRRSSGQYSYAGNFEPSELSVKLKNRSKEKKVPKSTSTENDVKRHISIANGLFDNKPIIKPRNSKEDGAAVLQDIENISNSGHLYKNKENEIQSFHVESKSIDVQDAAPYEPVFTGYECDGERELSGLEKVDILPPRQHYDENVTYESISVINYTGTEPPVPYQSREEMEQEVIYSVPSSGRRRLDFKAKASVVSGSGSFQESLFKTDLDGEAHNCSGGDQGSKNSKHEIRLLKDIIYRLNVELSHLLPENSSGRYIGKSVFPGKGPAPNWIMNTKYLTPLLAAYDEKLERQNMFTKKMQADICNFEKDIHRIVDENDRLHLKLEDIEKGGSNRQGEWHTIVEQTKLVIEENQLLLDEIDLQQQRSKEIEKKHSMEIAQLKISLSSITSDRDAYGEEIKDLKTKLSNTAVEPTSHIRPEEFSQVSSLKSQIDALSKDRESLIREVNLLRDNDKKLEKKVEKLKMTIKSEKEFRQYLNEVIDKSNEIAEDRDQMVEVMKVQEAEIRRIASKVSNDIRYNTDLGIEVDSVTLKVSSDKKSEDATLGELNLIESCVDLLVHSLEDLGSRCRHQEKDVHYYQNLLKEKDISLQEYEKETEELESKLDSLWRRAIKDV